MVAFNIRSGLLALSTLSHLASASPYPVTGNSTSPSVDDWLSICPHKLPLSTLRDQLFNPLSHLTQLDIPLRIRNRLRLGNSPRTNSLRSPLPHLIQLDIPLRNSLRLSILPRIDCVGSLLGHCSSQDATGDIVVEGSEDASETVVAEEVAPGVWVVRGSAAWNGIKRGGLDGLTVGCLK